MNRLVVSVAIAAVLALFGILSNTQALSPPPDGGYPGGNTAEGQNALFSVSGLGMLNTADGFQALYANSVGFANTAVGVNTLYHNINGIVNTATGYEALYSNTEGAINVASGSRALFSNTTGRYNTATGDSALYHNISGNVNTATGVQALVSNVTGGDNTAYGYDALAHNTEGSFNIALGDYAGLNLTTGDNNIDIGNRGVTDEFNTIRIGDKAVHTATYIAGISGQTASGGVAVFIDSDGKLGTLTSSARFKTEIKPMDESSKAVLGLKPVTFRYKHALDPKGIPQFGLLAEDVERVNPDLVSRDRDGKPYTVRYDAVNAMLLNEFLKEHRKVEQMQKQIDALTAGLQKVSAQLQLRSAPQTVLNNQ
jgi:trimeric autotransporter adhesin